jgi:hypothetical protein
MLIQGLPRSSQDLTDPALRGQSVRALSLLESPDATGQGIHAGRSSRDLADPALWGQSVPTLSLLESPDASGRDSAQEKVRTLATTGQADPPGSEHARALVLIDSPEAPGRDSTQKQQRALYQACPVPLPKCIPRSTQN